MRRFYQLTQLFLRVDPRQAQTTQHVVFIKQKHRIATIPEVCRSCAFVCSVFEETLDYDPISVRGHQYLEERLLIILSLTCPVIGRVILSLHVIAVFAFLVSPHGCKFVQGSRSVLRVLTAFGSVPRLVFSRGPRTDALSHENAFERQIYLYILTWVAGVAAGTGRGILNRVLILGGSSFFPLCPLLGLVVAHDQFLECDLLQDLLQAKAEVSLPRNKSNDHT